MRGIETKAVLGDEGKGPVQIAFQQGEINIDYQTTPAFNQLVRPQVEEGTAIPLYTAGMVEDGQLVRDPAFPDFPSFLEAYREARGTDPSGPRSAEHTYELQSLLRISHAAFC